MNAGAYGGEMKDVLYSVSHINFDGEVGCFEKESLKLGYVAARIPTVILL